MFWFLSCESGWLLFCVVWMKVVFVLLGQIGRLGRGSVGVCSVVLCIGGECFVLCCSW